MSCHVITRLARQLAVQRGEGVEAAAAQLGVEDLVTNEIGTPDPN